MYTIDTKTHSSKETAEFSFENADVESICYCTQWTKSKLSHASECVATKLCKPCTSFTWHLHSLCGMVWYRTLRVKFLLCSLSLSFLCWSCRSNSSLFCFAELMTWSQVFKWTRKRFQLGVFAPPEYTNQQGNSVSSPLSHIANPSFSLNVFRHA